MNDVLKFSRSRSAFYSSGLPAFEAALKGGATRARAEAEGLIAEYETLYGRVPDREAAIQQAVETIEKRDRRASHGGW